MENVGFSNLGEVEAFTPLLVEAVRLWALVQLTACWQCPLCGSDGPRDVLDDCPLRGEVAVDVAHCLHECNTVLNRKGPRTHIIGL